MGVLLVGVDGVLTVVGVALGVDGVSVRRGEDGVLPIVVSCSFCVYKAYLYLKMMTNINTTVTLFVTCESASSERRMDRVSTIAEIKERLCPITGVGYASMKLSLYNNSEQFVCLLDDETRLLGSYQVDDYMRIHVNQLCVYYIY